MRPELITLLDRVASELDAMRSQLESLADTLCADPEVALRHIGALQTLDLAGQAQAELATLLRAENPLAAIAEIRLDNLRDRLSLAVEA